jgi:hypothetical protein
MSTGSGNYSCVLLLELTIYPGCFGIGLIGDMEQDGIGSLVLECHWLTFASWSNVSMTDEHLESHEHFPIR